jgi:hypothetical protein
MKYLYHITDRKNIEQIKTLGLSPEFSKTGDGIYLSQDQGHAQGYEGHHGDWEVGTLLRIKRSSINSSLMEADDCDYPDMVGEDYDESDWIDSLRKSGQCMYRGVIKPNDIECLSGAGKWKKLISKREKASVLVLSLLN